MPCPIAIIAALYLVQGSDPTDDLILASGSSRPVSSKKPKLSRNFFCSSGSKEEIILAEPTLDDLTITSFKEILSPIQLLSFIGFVFPILTGCDTSTKV